MTILYLSAAMIRSQAMYIPLQVLACGEHITFAIMGCQWMHSSARLAHLSE